jgi:tRNA A-37 threonylcarbamoyl transferase component Bud32
MPLTRRKSNCKKTLKNKPCTKFPLGLKLGCGEQGCAYKYEANKVVKVTPLKNEAEADKWLDEACIGNKMSGLGIAPEVFDYFTCDNNGYIEMQPLKDAQSLPDGTVIRSKAKDGVVDHVSRIPTALQVKIVNLLKKMVDNGFIHMDNHVENMGFVKKRPVLFDFGFTQERNFGKDRDAALAFSIFQILEHAPWSEIKDTYFWSEARSLSPELPATMAAFKPAALAQAHDAKNVDVYVGCMCYLKLLPKPPASRYSDKAMDLIYDIRQGKANL